jgi:hypothetical protein
MKVQFSNRVDSAQLGFEWLSQSFKRNVAAFLHKFDILPVFVVLVGGGQPSSPQSAGHHKKPGSTAGVHPHSSSPMPVGKWVLVSCTTFKGPQESLKRPGVVCLCLTKP